jgi:hypothetical protein
MHATLSLAAAQAFVEYFGTWAGDFLTAFGRVFSGAVGYVQHRPLVAFAALAAAFLLYWVTRKS